MKFSSRSLDFQINLPRLNSLFRIQRAENLAWVVSALALALYTLTLAPDLVWGGGDFALYQTRAYLNQIVADGQVQDHALWVILAHPFTRLPVNNPAWRASFASAVFASLALGLSFYASWRITRSRLASLFAAGALGLSHTFWTFAVLPKVYSLNALMLTLCFLLLLMWRSRQQSGYLYLASFLFGLSFLNHVEMATLAPGFAVFILLHFRSENPGKVGHPILGLAVLSFVVGLTPYLLLLLEAQSAGNHSRVVLAHLNGLIYTITHLGTLLTGLAWGITLWVYQFPLTLPVGLFGFYNLWQKDRPVALFSGLAVVSVGLFLLAARDPRAARVYVYHLQYYLLAYVAMVPALAVGFQAIRDKLAKHPQRWQAAIILITFISPLFVYSTAPGVARRVLPSVPEFRSLPGRDNFTYVLSPWKHTQRGARAFAEDILLKLPLKSVLFADYSIWAMLQYLQRVEGQRLDVELVRLDNVRDQAGLILAYKNRRHLFLADTYRYYDLEAIGRHFQILETAPVYRLVPIQTERSLLDDETHARFRKPEPSGSIVPKAVYRPGRDGFPSTDRLQSVYFGYAEIAEPKRGCLSLTD